MTTLHAWRAGPPNPALERALARLAALEDVVHVAVMPDAHVADDVCVGTVTATTRRLFPAAVGSDIGCGMATVCLGAVADRLREGRVAARILAAFARAVPPLIAPPSLLPEELDVPLSSPGLEALRGRDGVREFGTLGRGNHFVELQRDEHHLLWLAVHSGSRCMGPAIRRHHETGTNVDGLPWLDAESEVGRAYLSDLAWATRYAALGRARIVERACAALADVIPIEVDPASRIETDHNHVRHEMHAGRALWVHRKGAQFLLPDILGIVPGSMGSATFHVAGRGVSEALCSAAHGAGRALPRGEALRRIRLRDLDTQMRGVWFDARLREALRDEAPAAYKDIGEVMRAQRELVRVVRRLSPVLAYKAA